MFKEVPAPVRPPSGIARRRMRLIQVVGVAGFLAMGLGGASVFGFAENGWGSVSATPEPPCLTSHTCAEENQIAHDEANGDQFGALCLLLREHNIELPQCAQVPD
ncbi:hypothetical protein [Mycobacterium sp.]|uniref:hypothetical protein n=1 Tax=Mycobacterium sp. TaxID=1785 RepID=UPI003A8823C5